MKRTKPLILLICLVALIFPGTGKSQSINEFEIKAVFIYNFTQFVQWPATSFDPSQDSFIIGVLGENVFGKYLEEAVAGETYQSRPIVIKYYATPKDVENCQILYVGSSTNVAKLTGDRPVLTVGEQPDFMEQKGLLRFFQEGNKVRIEINQSAASAAGLTISSKLLRLATIYNEK
jgi:hypothetical protein